MPVTSASTVVRARWIIPALEEPIEGGWLEIADGRIVSRGETQRSVDVDLGDASIIAGPVNAHTHLDLSAFTVPIPPGKNLPDWLSQVVAHRRAQATDPSNDIRVGTRMLVESGTTLVGDIAAAMSSAQTIQEAGLAGTVFREIIGLRPERFEPLWADATKEAGDFTNVRLSLSPHAPYSTSPDVYKRAGERGRSIPVATHWLESAEEREFLSNATGPFRDFLERIGAWTPDWEATPDPWEKYLGIGRWTLVHANDLTDAEIDRLCEPEWRARIASIVYCPRTHAHFGHAPHPVAKLLQRGLPVALGTDSLASNPDLSVYNEAVWLSSQRPDLSPRDILAMLTQHGAAALGWEREHSNLKPGSSATFAVVQPAPENASRPWEGLFAESSRVVAAMHRGRWSLAPAGHET